ncbi:unnamed protein product [Onchocerca flexuosa]|uniref:Uncharacterized protein n=1 Tax=Onchocerca flexuosa TaxID=387005 RepID=A0A183HL57_9BILA|nr:unnamed protein product [Onchocerca flexuosa]
MKRNDGFNFKNLFISIAFLLMSFCDGERILNESCKCLSKSACKSACLNGPQKLIINHSIQKRGIDYEEVEIIDERKCNSKSLQNIMLQDKI